MDKPNIKKHKYTFPKTWLFGGLCVLAAVCLIFIAYRTVLLPSVDTSLTDAISNGNLASVQDALEEGADINSSYVCDPFPRKVIPYDYACEHLTNLRIPEYLLSHGADINYFDKKGKTLMMYTGMNGTLKTCQHLLKYDPDLEIRDSNDYSALDYAALYHNADVLLCLIDAGANVTQTTLQASLEDFPSLESIQKASSNAISSYAVVSVVTRQLILLGNNPEIDPIIKASIQADSQAVATLLQTETLSAEQLEIASYYVAAFCTPETLELFVTRGVSLQPPSASISCLPHAEFAAAFGNVEMLEYLIGYAKEQKINLATEIILEKAFLWGQYDTTEYMLQMGAKIFDWTTLSRVAEKGNLSIIQLLTEYQACSRDAIRAAILKAIQSEQSEIVECLLSAISHTSVPYTPAELNEFCSFILYDDVDTLNVLCAYGATPEKCLDSRDIFHKAIIYGNYHVVEYLVQRGIDVHSDHDTAIYLAVDTGMQDIVELLVEHGADINCMEAYGISPLMRSAESSNHITDYLIEKGANVNACDENGVTPLMYAAAAGKTYCVETMLAAGADPDATDNQGRTARSYARKSHHLEIVKILKNASAVT